MWVNYGKIFNDFVIANLLLSVMVKDYFEDRLGFGKVMTKNIVAPFFRTQCKCSFIKVCIFHTNVQVFVLK